MRLDYLCGDPTDFDLFMWGQFELAQRLPSVNIEDEVIRSPQDKRMKCLEQKKHYLCTK
jgi:hypothetical protein